MKMRAGGQPGTSNFANLLTSGNDLPRLHTIAREVSIGCFESEIMLNTDKDAERSIMANLPDHSRCRSLYGHTC